MRAPATPLNEPERLAELHSLQLLDTGPEERFDRYTRLAKALLGVEIALVSLVDTERQWFKSRQGLSAIQTGRDISFCGHAVLNDDLFLVEDTLLDERFADNPLVTGAPFIRFYAGMPLHGPTGLRVGTLCTIDSHPRQLTPDERAALADLALALEQELNSRDQLQLAQRAHDTAQRLAAVLDNMHDGVITLNSSGTVQGLNRAAAALFGHELAHIAGRPVSLLIPALDPGNLASAQRHSELKGRRANGADLALTATLERLGRDAESGWTVIVRDLSAHQASYTMQTRFAAIVESSDNAIMSLTPDGVITSWNPAAERVFGYAKDEALGQSMLMLVPPHLTDETQALLARVAQGEAINHHQTLRVCRDWAQINVTTTLAPLRNAAGEVEGISEITRDISQEQRVGEQLQESEDRYQLAMRGSNAGLWDWQITTNEAYFSPRLCEMLGYASNGLGLQFAALTRTAHPEDEPLLRAALDEHLAGQRNTFDVECRLQTRDGGYRWFALRGVALRNEVSMPYRMAGSLIDVNERREAEAALQSTSAMLSSVLDGATGVSIVATDAQGLITVFNKGAEHLLGYTAPEMLGLHTPLRYVDPQYILETSAALSAALGKPVDGLRALSAPAMLGKQIETNFFRKDGSRVRVSAIVTLRHDAQGKRIGHVGIAIDITRQWEYEQSLREARTKAEESSVAKSQFLANVSHELRTPMNAILGMLQLMGNTALSARQADYVKKTDGAARSLLHLLNDILDFSKVEAGKMSLDEHPFRLDHLLRDLAVIAAANVGHKPVELLFDVDPHIPRNLVGDDQRLRQVLINLIGNAVKFTERGEVRLSLDTMSLSTHSVTLRFAVRDTGIGIAPENQQSIFSGFTQAESSITRRFGGTGLGLAISERMVSLMGGEMALQSAVGEGSEFSFAITLARDPSATAATDTEAQSAHPDLPQHLRILVTDGHPSARQVLTRALKTMASQIDVASSALEAITLIQASAAAKQPYHAAFIDCDLPDLAQGDVSEHLSKLARASQTLLIGTTTAAGREKLAERSLQEQALVDLAVVKPLTTGTLAEAIASALNARANPGALTSLATSRPQNSLQGLRLLVVEDNLNNQQVAQELLEAEGASVQLAGNGEVGVAAVADADPGFDAVLMDLQMPVMDGLTATRAIRLQLGLKTLPIIAMTANAMASDRDACLEAGMNDYVGKPFDLQNLIQTLLQHTGRATQGKQGRQHTAALTPLDVPEALLQDADQRGISLAAALRRLGGKPGPYTRMLDAFLQEIAQLPQELAQTLAGGDHATLVMRLHTLKGLAATLGDTALSAQAAVAEKSFKECLNRPPNPAADAALLKALQPALTHSTEQLSHVSQQLKAHLTAQAAQAPPAPAPAANPGAWLAQLNELAALLHSSDMRAIDIHAELTPPTEAAQAPAFAALDAAMSELDFARALTHCNTLLSACPPA